MTPPLSLILFYSSSPFVSTCFSHIFILSKTREWWALVWQNAKLTNIAVASWHTAYYGLLFIMQTERLHDGRRTELFLWNERRGAVVQLEWLCAILTMSEWPHVIPMIPSDHSQFNLRVLVVLLQTKEALLRRVSLLCSAAVGQESYVGTSVSKLPCASREALAEFVSLLMAIGKDKLFQGRSF